MRQTTEGGGGMGDGHAALYDRFAADVLTCLCRMVANRQDAEDLLLDVFMAAFASEALLRLPAARQLAWLRRVARNKAIDRYRRMAHVTLVPLDHVADRQDEDLTPDQYAERRQDHERLVTAVARLPADQQELLRLRFGLGFRLTQIAERSARPEGTVRKLLSRTLRRLRQLYEQIEREDRYGR